MEGLRLSSKNLPAKVGDMGWEEPLEKEMTTHCGILAWDSRGQGSLAGYRLQGLKESDMA